MVGHSFYQEHVRAHLERLKNLELQGKSYAPYDVQADGVCHINFMAYKVLQVYRNMGLWIYGTWYVAMTRITDLFVANLVFYIA